MQNFPIDIEPEQIVRWVIAERHQTRGSYAKKCVIRRT